MTLRRHPPEDRWLDVATGSADLPARSLAAAHAAVCPECRLRLEELRAAGGQGLRRAGDGRPPSAALWARVAGSIAGEPAAAARRASYAGFGLPLADSAWDELPTPARPRWRSLLAPGIRWAELAVDPASGSRLLVARSRPSRRFPRHQHLGPELGVVLAGGYTDETGDFTAGDFVDYAPGTVHRPFTDREEGCTILVRLEAPNRFFGWRGLLLRAFGRA